MIAKRRNAPPVVTSRRTFDSRFQSRANSSTTAAYTRNSTPPGRTLSDSPIARPARAARPNERYGYVNRIPESANRLHAASAANGISFGLFIA
jgi:hypothetical protein